MVHIGRGRLVLWRLVDHQLAQLLRVGGALVVPAGHARTASMLRSRGYDVRQVDVSELAKAEAGVTCCSLIVDSSQQSAASYQQTTES